ncbi:4Fe-4S dicluster domain-containing protein [bacterium]|nr:4Fe-4S dicluster domain-containing protein [candidate division CSSED10-310 bacterium]
MNSKDIIDLDRSNLSFAVEVSTEPGGENIFRCFACGTCTAGCPIARTDSRFQPSAIIRMVILGLREQVLWHDAIWLCAGCYTCQERCPQGVNIADLMMALRNIATREGYAPEPYHVQLNLLLEKGCLYEIDDFDNKKRVKADLPEIHIDARELRILQEKLLEELD